MTVNSSIVYILKYIKNVSLFYKSNYDTQQTGKVSSSDRTIVVVIFTLE